MKNTYKNIPRPNSNINAKTPAGVNSSFKPSLTPLKRLTTGFKNANIDAPPKKTPTATLF